MKVLIASYTLELVTGDIGRQESDAIVNVSNIRLAADGEVDGAIHHAGEAGITVETRRSCPPRLSNRGGGDNGAGKLPARYLVHTGGPVWSGGEEEELASAYRCSL